MSTIGEVAAAVRAIAERLPHQEIATATEALQECQSVFAAATEGSWAEEPAQVAAWLASALEQITQVAQLLTELREMLSHVADRLTNSASAPSPAPSSPTRPPRSPVDRDWGQRTRMRLPKRPGGKGPTLGIYVDDDGIEHTVRSGVEEDGLDKDLARYMWERRLVPAWMTNPGAAQHVEMKVAYRMRESGTRCVELAINNRVDPETWGCDRLLPAVLRRGQMLIIHDVEGTKIYRGRSE